jgi:hypothetical protein
MSSYPSAEGVVRVRPVAVGVDSADSAEVEHDPDLTGLLVGSGEECRAVGRTTTRRITR